MSIRTQKYRVAAVASPLGEDVLLLHRVRATEHLGRLFRIELDLQSEDGNLAFQKVVGQPITVRLELPRGGTRHFSGICSRFVQTADVGRLAGYHATLVPWLWLLTRTSDCRIFQEKSVPDIIKEVFRRKGLTDFDDALTGQYAPWEYCVQYRETDFNFVSRLMEHEGIYYYFTHEDGKHKLVLADARGGHDAKTDYEKIPYHPPDGETVHDEESVWDWRLEQELQAGAYALNDFDFLTPAKSLRASSAISRDHTTNDFEMYDYPGGYDKNDDGDHYSRIRIEELHAGFEVAKGQTDAHGVAAGYTFELTGFPREDQNREYLVTTATIDYASDLTDAGVPASASQVGGKSPLKCSFSAIAASTPYRSSRTTYKPVVQGPQTAIVVGPAGEEIHTDSLGRVKVRFHWDRHSPDDDTSSCWIRVSQLWAGRKWGAMFLPRVGQEVIVDFLEGDPDQPIVTGRVYNGDSKPPYELPAYKTMSTIKSQSSKGGGGFNELRFEDKKGEEQVFLHGEKDLHVRVKNNIYEIAPGQYHLMVGNQYEKIGSDKYPGDKHQTVTQDHLEVVKRDHFSQVVGKQAIEVGQSRSLKVCGDVNESFDGNHSQNVGGDLYLKAKGIVVESLTGITIKCGGSSIVIDPSGVTITGPMLTLDGAMVRIASGPGSPPTPGVAGALVAPIDPDPAAEADVADPGQEAKYKRDPNQSKKGKYAPQPGPPWVPPGPGPNSDPNKKSWIEIELVDDDSNPVPGQRYEITLPDGRIYPGTLDNKGFARVDGIDPGTCKVTFPDLDKDTWGPA